MTRTDRPNPRPKRLPTGRAALLMLVERAYAALLPGALALACLVGLALFGVFAAVPWWAHAGLLVLGIGLASWLLWRGAGTVFLPHEDEVLERLEAEAAGA